MPTHGPPRILAITLSLLLAALLFHAFLWPRAAWLFVDGRDRPAVERALAGAAASFSGITPEDFRWMARPAVIRPPGRVCVLIVMWRAQPFHGRSGYKACYDARTGAVLEERAWL
ncbi:MAG TPA: hypothetical protein VEW26_07980 [Allosphingosinicella sp.]|nr:hypothetical protein [Allosphingosinicella sp.]